MTYATTFSGIGGWELGLNACGWELLWQCEREEFCRSVLSSRFGVPICPDVRGLVKWLRRNRLASPDVLVGSPPCQPFSQVAQNAGGRRGTADERHLYPAFINAVRKIRPRYVLMEQVPAILSDDGGRSFGEYIGGLVKIGYDVIWHCIPTTAVGACHRRERVWIVANATGERCFPRKVHHCPTEEGGFPQSLKWNRGRRCQFEFGAPVSRTVRGLPICDAWRVLDGLPGELDRIRALGNAVMPEIPYLIGQAINQIES